MTTTRTARRLAVSALALASLGAVGLPATSAGAASCPTGGPVVSPAWVVEGNKALVGVTGCSTTPSFLPWSTTAGTAGSADFSSSFGSLTVPEGSWTRTIEVQTTADTVKELNEAFTVKVGSSLPGRVTVLDNDPGGFSVLGPKEWRSGGPGQFLLVRSDAATTSARVTLKTYGSSASTTPALTSPTSGVVDVAYGQRTRLVQVGDFCRGYQADFTVGITSATTTTRAGVTALRVVDGSAAGTTVKCPT